ncbi:MAG TPA: type II secretion system ATPase GspE [Spirochaetota bacterium]|nr:type II secretion system ATPase GspE [Spirochaetota bacterium]HOR94609.1 type II secretion system ATPase GspE [Spirochaetota bacterium]HRR60392.1 type II secretion system ATPase GspE [Spirochaetota bacterium]HRV14892.1 type II secretion system ATPase GspE [Spirochaetota bacterium]
MIGIKTKKLGQILIDKRLISQEDLQDALLSQQNTPLKIGQILIKKGLISEDDVLIALATQYSIDYVETLEFNDTDNILGNIPVQFLKRYKIVPYTVKKNTIKIAINDPLLIQPLDNIKIMYDSYKIIPVLSTEKEIMKIINNHFDVLKEDSTTSVIENLEESDFEILSSPITETEDILDMANEAPIIRLVNTVIKQAIEDRASDIHIEPFEKDLIIRFRIDGILYNMFTPPKKYQAAIISRIKIMSNLNIAENRLPQDGRIQLKVGGKDIDIRVSVFPTYYGERIVLRLLNKSDMKFDLDSLGFSKDSLSIFNELIKKTHGIILVTGPTGSGKTTTLYSVLTRLNTYDVNILTVEDPIEYQLHGVGQMQVKPKIDLTFAAGLRSILRQDPDIIMVGEIRDLETAEIAIQAALTGHRVFSTIHTNDAASGITRLLDMGVEPFLIASSVNAFLAQRLVRTICPHCKQSYKPDAVVLKDLGIKSTQLQGKKLYKGKGCDKCINTGYLGRTGIYELLPITNDIRKLIMEHADAVTIKEKAIANGMKTLLLDGIEKAFQGITTLEEVLRVS